MKSSRIDSRQVWIVRGAVTDPSAYPEGQATLGQTEWQFSDGPSGMRTMSADYIDLEAGLRAHSGHVIYFEDDEQSEAREEIRTS